jgi:hypothetical protein
MSFNDHYEDLLITAKLSETCRIIKMVYTIAGNVPVVSDGTQMGRRHLLLGPLESSNLSHWKMYSVGKT